MRAEKIREKSTDLFVKYRRFSIYFIIVLAILAIAIFLGKPYAQKAVQNYVNGLNSQYRINNPEIFDNLAIIRNEIKELKRNFEKAKNELEVVRQQRRKEWANVTSSKDPRAIAQFFDNTVDSYIPSN